MFLGRYTKVTKHPSSINVFNTNDTIGDWVSKLSDTKNNYFNAKSPERKLEKHFINAANSD